MSDLVNDTPEKAKDAYKRILGVLEANGHLAIETHNGPATYPGMSYIEDPDLLRIIKSLLILKVEELQAQIREAALTELVQQSQELGLYD